MTTSPPTSTTVSESAVIAAPLSHVWHLIKLPDFHKFWSKLKASEEVKGASPETDIVKWTFEDGGVWEIKMEEWSVSSEDSWGGGGWGMLLNGLWGYKLESVGRGPVLDNRANGGEVFEVRD